MRPLSELLSGEPFWPELERWFHSATNHVEVLPPTEVERGACLEGLQVTTRSPLGAVSYETGGVLIQHGWIRVLGSGHFRLPRDLRTWNQSCRPDRIENDCLLVADDILGGLFAINGGGLPGEAGRVLYFAPDRLDWEGMTLGYGDFVRWLVDGDVSGFYGDHRWTGWEAEVRQIPGDRTLSIYPPLWTKGPPLEQRSRRPVPTAEAIGAQFDFRVQLGISGDTE